MARRLPSLNALKAFESAARFGSFTLAAQELNVTHAAVSRHIRELEGSLGTKLFHRTGRGVELTDAGRTLGPDLTPAFEQLVRATERFIAPKPRGQLVISAEVNFAARWLLPRLEKFSELHPHVRVVLDPDSRCVDFTKFEAHVGIRFGGGKWRGIDAVKLTETAFTPVCSPAFAATRSLWAIETLASVPLIAEDNHDHWSAWLQVAVAGVAFKPTGPVLKGHLALAAAEAGQGFALNDAISSADAILSGRLVELFDVRLPIPDAYYLVRGANTKESTIQAAFRVWMQDEIAATMTALEKRQSDQRIGMRDEETAKKRSGAAAKKQLRRS
jgi:LysR family transcriptional regulator, glycine cleavage system transcriptional activator